MRPITQTASLFAWVALCGMVGAGAAQAQAVRGNSGIRGVVVDTAGRPLSSVRVFREGGDTSITDSLGRFELLRLALGRHVFVAERRGFEAMVFEVDFTRDTVLTATIPMEPRAGASGGGSLIEVGFNQRRANTPAAARAVFLGPDEIDERGAQRLSQLLEGIEGVTVRTEQGSLAIPFGRDGRCIMNVFVDGARAENVFGAPQLAGGGRGGRGGAAAGPLPTGLDGLMPASQVRAVEVYPIAAHAPARFQYTPNIPTSGRAARQASTSCGSIVIWTGR
jgi:hypothetical protein